MDATGTSGQTSAAKPPPRHSSVSAATAPPKLRSKVSSRAPRHGHAKPDGALAVLTCAPVEVPAGSLCALAG